MNNAQEIKEAIRRIAVGGRGKQLHLVGTVKSVEGETCTVDIAGLELDEVRLTAASDGADGKLLLTPTAGSRVLMVDLSGGELRDMAVVGYTHVEKIEATCGQIELNGGENGGLVNVKELTDKLNNIEKDINTLKQALSTWTPTPQDGGASLKIALTSWMTQQLVQTQASEIEDDKITH
ncbi:MAG: hypothetical protein IJ684_03005 [Bacteroidales bacterium]|nr:hypothetical protein [Bacteroidales bacterium]